MKNLFFSGIIALVCLLSFSCADEHPDQNPSQTEVTDAEPGPKPETPEAEAVDRDVFGIWRMEGEECGAMLEIHKGADPEYFRFFLTGYEIGETDPSKMSNLDGEAIWVSEKEATFGAPETVEWRFVFDEGVCEVKKEKQPEKVENGLNYPMEGEYYRETADLE